MQKNEPRVQAEFDHLTSFLSALTVTETNSGLIHGDFELDNLFWQDDTIALLDFDDCSYSWYVADVAFALRDLFATGVDQSFFFSSRRRHTRFDCDWSSDVCSSD